jgi:cytochrome c2
LAGAEMFRSGEAWGREADKLRVRGVQCVDMKRLIGISASCYLFIVSALAAQTVRGDAKRGGELFQKMKCVSCHAVRGTGGSVGPALGAKPGTHDSANAVAAAMWSHAVKMWEAMEKAGMAQPKISQQQAADLVAYIAGKVRPDPPGDAARGRKVYEAKLCASCHDQYSGAPEFTRLTEAVSPYWMVAGLWDHGRGMLSRIVERKAAWQELTAQEVGDILAYLNTRK